MSIKGAVDSFIFGVDVQPAINNSAVIEISNRLDFFMI